MDIVKRGRKPHQVYQYDTNNNLLNVFSSIKEAAKLNYLNEGNICAVIKGKRKTCGGFIWRDVPYEQ